MGNTFFFGWEPALMAWLQANLGVFCVKLAVFLTLFGQETIMVLLLGYFYWCRSKEIGIYMGTNLFAVSVWNPLLKNIFLRRRPYFDCPEITCLKKVSENADLYDIAAQGYSFPSGHSSSAAALYGSLARWFKKRWLTFCCGILILLVGVSRFCLGVHFPTDVLTGWALGLLAVFLVPWLKTVLKKKWLFYLVLLLTALPGLFYCTTSDYYTSLGMMIGFFAGNLFEERFVRFQNTRSIPRSVLRILGGIGIYLGLNALLKLPFSGEFLSSPAFAARMVRTARYAVILFVDIGLYPALFALTTRIGLKKKPVQ